MKNLKSTGSKSPSTSSKLFLKLNNGSRLFPGQTLDDTIIELLLHLEYVPYLHIPIKFNAAELLQEAQHLRSRYSPYLKKNDDWLTLGLRTPGGRPGRPLSQPKEIAARDTKFAKRCPRTRALLAKVVDWDNCSRIRFRVLKAKSKVACHRDGNDSYHHITVNISLNMPEGCDYLIDLSPAGRRTKKTKVIPFKNSGSIFLVNNSKFHRLENKSRIDRYHLTAFGRVKLHEQTLLKLARKQNQIRGIENLIKALKR